jgi:hypothetical protein
VKWYALIGVVIKNIQLIEMIKNNVNIIQADLNLEVNKVFGLRDGLVVEENGTKQVVLGVTIEDIQNQRL